MGKEPIIQLALIIIIIIIAISLLITSGCVDNGNVDTPNGDEDGVFIYGNATVESIDVMILESFPVQVRVNAKGYLPDGCTEIDRIIKQREGDSFFITITTKRPAEAICTQAIVPFEEGVPLDVIGLKAGMYDVNVNGITGTFELSVDNILGESSNGSTMEVRSGDFFTVQLNENPTTGYQWSLDLSQGLILISDEYIPANETLLGSGGVHIWEIHAASRGTQTITAVYKRPWENETMDEERFELTVIVN